MHEECRHRLKRLDLLGLHQLCGESKILKVGGDLITDALEQFEFLDRVGKAVDTISQDCAAEPASPGAKRHADSIPTRAKMCPAGISQTLSPFLSGLVKVE